jgi:hypothetical protein
MPELIDRLARFFEHGEEEESGIVWSVSAGGLEGSKRHYRIWYSVGGDATHVETTIDVDDDDWVDDLSAFLTVYRGWTLRTCDTFATAVQRMILLDHWLNYVSGLVVD